jgi:hypothetical protein
LPLSNEAISPSRFAAIQDRKPSMVIPSTPAEPLFALTRL